MQPILQRIYDAAGFEDYIYRSQPEPALSANDAEWSHRLQARELYSLRRSRLYTVADIFKQSQVGKFFIEVVAVCKCLRYFVDEELGE